MNALDPQTRKHLVCTYINQFDYSVSRLLARLGVFSFSIIKIPGNLYKIGNKARWYHPVTWLVIIALLLIYTFLGLIEGIMEAYDSISKYDYTHDYKVPLGLKSPIKME